MDEAMYDLLYILETVTNILFKGYFLYLVYRYIEVRRLKA
tara:strand:- start:1707 stop:1826 length:120 start_codon:yes stop_codon:yes gene_type:complete